MRPVRPKKNSSFQNFLHYVRRHRIPIHPENRKIGIVCTLIGWGLIAFNETHQLNFVNNFVFLFDLTVQFFTGAILLFISSLFLGKDFLTVTESTDKKIEDASQHISHLSVTERKKLIFWRGFIAIVGYSFLSWAKSNTQIIDNSAAFSSDAIMYALIMRVFLKQQLSRQQLISLALILLGVCFMFSFNIFGFNSNSHNTLSLFIALASAAALAIVIFLNTVIIQHEPPLRVAFFQCLIGFIVALCLTSIWLIFNPSILSLIDPTRMIYSILSGTIYAIALLFFFNAFLYTEPFLIVTLGYSLFAYTIFFSWLAGHGIYPGDLIGASLISLGGLGSIFFQYQEDRKKTHGNIAGYPIYLSTLKEKFRALKQDFLADRLGKFEYLSQRHEFNKLIFEYANEIRGSEIEAMELRDGNVFFALRSLGGKMLSDGGCRSAPLEILNFDTYEKEESTLIFQMIAHDDVIFDIGANVGWYTLQLAKKFKQSTIHSFEPIPQTFEILEKNVQLNKVTNVTLHRVALGDKGGKAAFFYFQSGSAIASRRNLLDHNKILKITCEITTLDTVAEELNLKRLDFLKCDVEGSELDVIKGGLQTIKRFRPIIYIELFHGWCKKFDYLPNDVLTLLQNIGYQAFRFYEQSLIEIKEIDETVNDFNFVFLCSELHGVLIGKFKKIN